MKEIQVEEKTVQAAVDKALKELALRRDQVEVIVLEEGKKGFLGIGAKNACVVVREKKWTGDARNGKSGEGNLIGAPLMQGEKDEGGPG